MGKTPDFDDEWIRAFTTMDAARLHAIGAIVFEWNRCESEMYILVHRLFRISNKNFKILIADCSNVEIPAKAKSYCDANEVSEDLKNFIDHICKCFDINRINRNTIIHAWPNYNKDFRKSEFWVSKGHHIPKFKFQGSLEELRTVADQITLCRAKLTKLNDAILTAPHGPLPDRPPLPDRIWRPDDLNHQEPGVPPQSSRA